VFCLEGEVKFEPPPHCESSFANEKSGFQLFLLRLFSALLLSSLGVNENSLFAPNAFVFELMFQSPPEPHPDMIELNMNCWRLPGVKLQTVA